MAAMEAGGKWHQPQSGGDFTPAFIEIKGFCTWDERREKGLSRAQVKRHYDEPKTLLPEELRVHFKDLVPSGLFTYKIKVKVTAGHAHDIKMTLNDIFEQGKQNIINNLKPYVVTERTPEVQRKFATFGRAVDAVKTANRDKAVEQEIIVEPKYLAIFLKINGDERPKFIGEVRRDGSLDWNDTNCQALLGKSGKEIEALNASRNGA